MRQNMPHVAIFTTFGNQFVITMIVSVDFLFFCQTQVHSYTKKGFMDVEK